MRERSDEFADLFNLQRCHMEFQAALDAVRSLPVDDQVRLVDQIQDDLLTQANDFQLPPEQMKEMGEQIATSLGLPSAALRAKLQL